MHDREGCFFFVRLLLLFVEPSSSGIDGDSRRSFSSEFSKNINAYAIERKGHGGDYSLKWDLCTSEEFVNFDGIVVLNQGRNFGNCWNPKKENFYDPVIHENMGIPRFLDMKQCLKMNPW